MSNPNQNQSKPPMPVAAAPAQPADDPLIIAMVTTRQTISIGSHGGTEWSIRAMVNSVHHNKLRFEECPEGIRIIFANKQVPLYEEHTVYAGNIADVCRVPLSSLKPEAQEAWKKCQNEVRR